MHSKDNNYGLTLSQFDKKLIPLIKDIASDITSMKIAARKKIVNMGEKVLDDVYKMLKAKNKTIRWEAAKILQEINSEKSIPVFKELFKNDNLDIRWIAEEALIKLGRKSIIPVMELIIANGDLISVRHGAHHVLTELFNDDEKKEYSHLLSHLQGSIISESLIASEANKYIKNYKD